MGTRNKYAYLAVIIIAGYALFSFPCLFHSVTGYPCPACGTRRALFALLNGNIYESILINPYGLLLLLLATSYIIGTVSDLIRKRQQFRNWLKQTEQYLANKYILTILIALTILNWIWNINKGL
ncbi:DUF2752 domain-containing protein [Parabacteroides gordonii]|uniref:DUF2752 domain-containing protein n=1 Tax=Parabacteroides gordonii TaxID=574930 RepID=UPI0004058710|nr:DUF2752 domain-containing protein [Parabacteroides gordonii]MCA5586276.1 DUF2752 domain-containing protein [Parabacteroides gordonii]RGP18642.1 DUF2752 domain-containing protein [Parabacteroides gordonii]